MVIPDWDGQHVIPPVRDVPPEQQGLPENRSPYEANLVEVVQRFANTPERVQLIHGLMDYRDAFYAAGVTEGFQWINGSFAEHVELTPRPGQDPRPYDIDVVTFYRAPDEQPPELSALFDSTVTWDKYRIDAYAVVLDTTLTANTVETIAYWQGMRSTRRRDHQPKGFVQVDLDPENDPKARAALNAVKL